LKKMVTSIYLNQSHEIMIVNHLQSFFVYRIPIPLATAEERAAIAGLERRLLDLRSAGESALAALEGELNRRVYGLFGVSEEEIGIIEGKVV
jgi:adenine-specific DNA-methyltransferase